MREAAGFIVVFTSGAWPRRRRHNCPQGHGPNSPMWSLAHRQNLVASDALICLPPFRAIRERARLRTDEVLMLMLVVFESNTVVQNPC